MTAFQCPRCTLVVEAADPAALVCPRCAYPNPPVAQPMWPTRPPLRPDQERQWAMWLHLSAFSAVFVPVGSLLGPLILWLVKKDESAFVDRNGRRAVNFQLTVMLVAAVAMVGYFAFALATFGVGGLLGFPLLFLLVLGLLVLEVAGVVMAALAAGNGVEQAYPLAIPFLRVPPVPSAWQGPRAGA